MELEYTDHEYLVECTEGCGEISDWLQSRFLAEQPIKNHSNENITQLSDNRRNDVRDKTNVVSFFLHQTEREEHHETSNNTLVAGPVQRDSG